MATIRRGNERRISRWLGALVLAASGVAGVSGSAVAEVGQPSPTQVERLEAGDILIENVTSDRGLSGLRARFLVRAASNDIWHLLVDYPHYREVFTDVDGLDVLSETGAGARVRYHVHAAWMKFAYTLERSYTEPGLRLTWHRLDGDFKDLQGEWSITPGFDGQRALVTCESYVDIGFAVPTAVVRAGAISDMRSTMARMRARLEAASR